MRVLESVAAPGATTKFIDQVVTFAPDDIEFVYFSWRAALLGRYDVFHVHWPEFLLRSDRRSVALARSILFRLLIARIKRSGTPVVRTHHNLAPHASGDEREARLLGVLDQLTTEWVTLNPCTPEPGRSSTVILHGDYRAQFSTLPKKDAAPGRMLFFGRIEEYKGVEGLVDAFESAARPGEVLRIVGRPTAEMRVRLEKRAATWTRSDAHLELRLEHISDVDMVAEVTEAQVVVLPYKEMHNSGVALVALSLARPIVVPAGCTNEALASEVGPGWVLQYQGTLNSGSLRKLLSHARIPSTGPDLAGRDWRTVGAQYADVFRRVAESPANEPSDPAALSA